MRWLFGILVMVGVIWAVTAAPRVFSAELEQRAQLSQRAQLLQRAQRGQRAQGAQQAVTATPGVTPSPGGEVTSTALPPEYAHNSDQTVGMIWAAVVLALIVVAGVLVFLPREAKK